MRALLLAAGFGTRLRPITDARPKCLVPIEGKPLLQIWLEKLTAAGIGPFLVNTHYLPEQVESYVTHSPFADRVTLVHEHTLLGTAGTLIRNLKFFSGEDALLIHADNFCLADMLQFSRAHDARPRECLMTMMTFRTNDPSSCGILELDARGVVLGFHEKQEHPPGNLANAAIYIVSSEMLSILEKSMSLATDFSNEIIPKMIGRIYTYQTNEIFADIGTVAAYEALQETLRKTERFNRT